VNYFIPNLEIQKFDRWFNNVFSPSDFIRRAIFVFRGQNISRQLIY